jgi:predicted DCC family thiol-disulfide oxidoreductase YuxK
MKIGVTLIVCGDSSVMKALAQLTVLFDGSCSLCRASVARVRPFDRHGHIEFLDLHDPSSFQRFPNIDRELALRSMQGVDSQGRIYTGAEAWAQIGLRLPGWKLLACLLLVPGIHWIARIFYAWIARNRYRWNREVCADGSCALHLPAPTDLAAKH